MANTPESQFSRRTLAKGAAWAVPAVALAVGAPAYALSKLQAPTDVRASLTACNKATVSWGEPSEVQYQVEYSVNGTDFKETTPVTGTSTTVTAEGTENIRAVQVRRYDSDKAYSDWVIYTIPTPELTGVVAQVTQTGYSYTVSWNAVSLAGTYTVEGRTGNSAYETMGTTTDTSLSVTTNKRYGSVRVSTTVCGVVVSTAVSPTTSPNGLGTDQTPTVERSTREAATSDTQEKKSAEAKPSEAGKSPETKAPAAKKSAPTVEPTPSATPTPGPSVSKVPDPEPIVTEPVVVPEPVPVPTPSA